MTATASFLLNCSSSNPPMTIDAHAKFKANYASFWGLQVEDVTKLNAARVGAVSWNMLLPTSSIGNPKIPLNNKKKIPKMVPELELGRMVNDKLVFRQNVYIRSYEVGPDGTIFMETILNLLQETCLNHLKTIGMLHDGLGSTPEMCKKNLIWVTTKMQVVVDRYPVWGDVVQIDTWKAASGRNGLCNNWMFCDSKTGEVLIRASSTLVMINKETRRLAKFPNEVLVELEQYLMDAPPLVEHHKIKWSKRDETIIDLVHKGLTSRWSDLDMNQHVNNAKYIGWILESVPRTVLKNYELASMTLEYHQECEMDRVLQSHTFVIGTTDDAKMTNHDHVDCEHLLELEIGGGRDEIMKGRTRWLSKHGKSKKSGCKNSLIT